MPHPSSARPLQGGTALVTGVSRRRGIGYAVAVELASLGASVFLHHYGPHDADQPWGGDDLDAVRAGVREALVEGATAGDASADLRDADAVEQLVEQAWREATPFGRWGRPTDPARLIGWLATDQGVWVAGQVITTDGGMGLT